MTERLDSIRKITRGAAQFRPPREQIPQNFPEAEHRFHPFFLSSFLNFLNQRGVPNAKKKREYAIGIDFGTLSARAVLLDLNTGNEIASASEDYPSGVIDQTLPGTRRRLSPNSAFQDPADYLYAMERSVRSVLRQSRISPGAVIGIGTDFTSCTVLPVSSDGEPLCFKPRWRKNPHAWVKLWKHHTPQPEADRINKVALDRGESWLEQYGGKYSSEWFFSKLLETVEDAPDVYAAADRFIEGCDWIVWQLCGRETRNVSAAGFKGMRIVPNGNGWAFPSPAFFGGLNPRLRNVISEKVSAPILQLGEAAGTLTPAMAHQLGLPPGIPVAAGNIDAHAAVPACGVTRPGSLVMMMGTSTCHLLIGDTEQPVEGICGVVEHGIVPGLWGYEAGQSGVGDLFAWYVDHAIPKEVAIQAAKAKLTVHELLSREAAKLSPGQSGLIALDWWNGNRSILVNSNLTGLILGLTIQTKPAEIYRALIEATAFGTRKIIEAFTSKGIPIDEVHASGGLAQKNPVLMQIYADVIQRPIRVATAGQGSAFGAAMHGAVAAGKFSNIHEAARKLVQPSKTVYRHNRAHKRVYDQLYAEYERLHDFFGRDTSSPMFRLTTIQEQAR